MKKVIVFGSLNMDLTIEVDRVPYGGETLPGRNFLSNPGGKGANQAVAVSKAGLGPILSEAWALTSLAIYSLPGSPRTVSSVTRSSFVRVWGRASP